MNWTKWWLSDSSSARAVAAARIAEPGAGPPAAPSAGTDPLAAGLAALAIGDGPLAGRVLAEASGTDATGATLAALGDVYALQRDWPMALATYDRAERVRPGDPVPVLGAAVVELRSGRPRAAAARLRALRAQRPGDRVVEFYLTVALLCVATDVRATDRDDRPVIVSAGQLEECRSIWGQLAGLSVEEPELRVAAEALVADVQRGERWEWREVGGNPWVLVLVLLLATVVGLAGAYLDNVSVIVSGGLLFAGSIALYVLTHRRPAWELNAQDLGSVLTRRGAEHDTRPAG